MRLRRTVSGWLTGFAVCSYDPQAEQNCEKHLALAATLDPSDPEVYQVRFPLRLTVDGLTDARDRCTDSSIGST